MKKQTIDSPLFSGPLYPHGASGGTFLLSLASDNYVVTPVSEVYLCGDLTHKDLIFCPANKVSDAQTIVWSHKIKAYFDDLDGKTADTPALCTLELVVAFILKDVPADFRQRSLFEIEVQKLVKIIAQEYVEDGNVYYGKGGNVDWIPTRKPKKLSLMAKAFFASYLAEHKLNSAGIHDGNTSISLAKKWIARTRCLIKFFVEHATLLADYETPPVLNSSAVPAPTAPSHLLRSLIEEIVVLESRLEVGQYILDLLVAAPWNVTSMAIFEKGKSRGDNPLKSTEKAYTEMFVEKPPAINLLSSRDVTFTVRLPRTDRTTRRTADIFSAAAMKKTMKGYWPSSGPFKLYEAFVPVAEVVSDEDDDEGDEDEEMMLREMVVRNTQLSVKNGSVTIEITFSSDEEAVKCAMTQNENKKRRKLQG